MANPAAISDAGPVDRRRVLERVLEKAISDNVMRIIDHLTKV